ncbi:MAG TPA: hypothetical protein VFZ61_21970, partial [Polyangiales bacterium]
MHKPLLVRGLGRYRLGSRGNLGGCVRRCPTCQAHYNAEAKVCPIDGGVLEDVPDPLIGRTIGGRYQVCELIGAGGM